MKKYTQFLITADPFNEEVLSSLLWQLDISGINEDVNCIKVFVEEGSKVTADNINEILNLAVKENLLRSFTLEENIFEEKNWNEEWEKSINVIEVSSKIVIKPTFREYEKKPGQIVITIDPKMSFGTGEHQTTKLILTMLEEINLQNKKVLDVGSGTGILAIASVKLGAGFAAAVDNDEWCLDNAKENCELNNCTEKVDVKLGEIKDVEQKDFDIVVANIQKNILLSIKEDIAHKIKPGGTLFLSGLLEHDEKDITAAYGSIGFEFQEKKQLDDWIALRFNKN